MTTQFKTAYQKSDRKGLSFAKPSRTKQSEKDACDINLIVPKIARGEIINHINTSGAQYADLTSYGTSYHENLNAIINANNSFMQLPSNIRKKFDNDPASFLDFINDASNYDEAVSLGLINKKVEVSSPTQTASETSSTTPTASPKPSESISEVPSGASS